MTSPARALGQPYWRASASIFPPYSVIPAPARPGGADDCHDEPVSCREDDRLGHVPSADVFGVGDLVGWVHLLVLRHLVADPVVIEVLPQCIHAVGLPCLTETIRVGTLVG
jgi:hypothetical protein